MNNSPFSPFVGRHRTLKDYKRRQSEIPSDLIDWDAPEIPELDKQRIIYEEYIKESNEDHEIETLINEEICKVAYDVYLETFHKQYDDKLLKERSQVNLLLGQVKMFEGHSKELENTIRELEGQTRDLEVKNKDLETRNEELIKQKNHHETQSKESKLFADEIEVKYRDMCHKNELLATELGIMKGELESQKENDDKNLREKLTEYENTIEGFKVQIKELEDRVETLMAEKVELEEQNKDLEFQSKELEAQMSCQIETMLLKKSEADDLKRKFESAKNQLAYYKRLAKGEAK